jgi:hypothetical protein
MKKYELEIIGSKWDKHIVIAETYLGCNGYYEFKNEYGGTVACYPIDRTIIKNVEIDVSE